MHSFYCGANSLILPTAIFTRRTTPRAATGSVGDMHVTIVPCTVVAIAVATVGVMGGAVGAVGVVLVGVAVGTGAGVGRGVGVAVAVMVGITVAVIGVARLSRLGIGGARLEPR